MFIRVSFDRNYRAAGDPHKKTCEWPPSPYRVACAMINAFYLRSRFKGVEEGKDKVAEFMTLPLPRILTKSVDKKVITTFVPPVTREYKLKPRCFPFVATDEVYYEWRGAQCVADLLQRISYLGAASSLVSVTVSENAPDGDFYLWQPDARGLHNIRCPFAGMLENSDAMYAGNGQRDSQIRVPDNYYSRRKVIISNGVIPDEVTQKEYFSHSHVFGLESNIGLNITRSVSIANSVRAALVVMAGKLGLIEFKKEIIGKEEHSNKEHLAFVPLPAVCGPFPSGQIKGFMVCLPVSLSHYRKELNMCLYEMQKDIKFKYHFKGELVDDLLAVSPRGLKSLDINFWGGKSNRWTTATPVECPFFEEKWKKKLRDLNYEERQIKLLALMEQWCKEECSLYLLPTPKTVEFFSHGKWGGYTAREFLSGRKNPGSYLTHITVTFPIEVSGPIMLGRGRNFGTGLMYPIGIRQSQRTKKPKKALQSVRELRQKRTKSHQEACREHTKVELNEFDSRGQL